eukprot:6491993-Amphidinium_carterae.3
MSLSSGSSDVLRTTASGSSDVPQSVRRSAVRKRKVRVIKESSSALMLRILRLLFLRSFGSYDLKVLRS